ncbi:MULTISPECIES: flagellar hook assembly protein FlgD [Ramlibacter]|uniref:Basal-body rod modification protein FlgD n=1 Tax=Ramlibacter pinisoli TaxID=2682844 RepID=A0A6N8IUX5_9BURK|nr:MULTISPECIES: flagellar hook capping FlgD N-terminal domain-containing protein [Ramlibacter]MBA2964778.1 flagellar hook capping protein [Ramlibacter sp. CGMCC 1.13660]MVQ29743.1 flagellar hook capping protein [Ramlibacter pinisoli]
MELGAISGTAASAAGQAMGLQDFLKVLLTQLNYQDPLKPMDNQAFMAQMAQFTSLEQSQRLNDKLELLVANQAALQSIGLIGKTVSATGDSGSISGVVSSLSLQGTSPLVSITTTAGSVVADVDLSRIVSVR